MARLGGGKGVLTIAILLAGITMTALAQTFQTLATTPGRPFLMTLTQGRDGNLYGTTIDGGTNLKGVVFEVTPTGIVTTLYNFCEQADCSDGYVPQGGVIQANDGNFYGTTRNGGDNGTDTGTVYRLAPRGELTSLYSFCSGVACADGAVPEAGLIQAPDGNLYGTTYGGGANGYGTVFEVTPSGGLTVLHSFCSRIHCNDGAYPYSSLLVGTDGSLYGTTSDQDIYQPNREGTIFKVSSNGGFTLLHNFKREDGFLAETALVQGKDGNFYGTTAGGGDLTCNNGYGCGTVFTITPQGALTTLYMFGGLDGNGPLAPLIQATDGNFYGTTYSGGDQGFGTAFQITPGGILTTLHSFDFIDGINPANGLLQATSGKLYGATGSTVFTLDMGLGPFVAFMRGYGRVGRTFGILGQGFTGSTGVTLNGTAATFVVKSDTFLTAKVPAGATTGYVTVTMPIGTLTSNVPFHVIK